MILFDRHDLVMKIYLPISHARCEVVMGKNFRIDWYVKHHDDDDDEVVKQNKNEKNTKTLIKSYFCCTGIRLRYLKWPFSIP